MTKLYIKASDRGLQYFGKTTRDPYKYKGSGKHWTAHLKKHNPEVQTIVIGEYKDNDLMLVEHALGFSAANNIVLSQDWANLIPENGKDGGTPGTPSPLKGILRPEHSIQMKEIYKTPEGKARAIKIGLKNTERFEDPEERVKQSEACQGINQGEENGMFGKSGSENPFAQAVQMNQYQFVTVKEASEQLGISTVTIQTYIKSKDYPGCQHIEEVTQINREIDKSFWKSQKSLNLSKALKGKKHPTNAGSKHHNARAMIIDGIEFGYFGDAAKAGKGSTTTIRKRLKDPLNTNYTYL